MTTPHRFFVFRNSTHNYQLGFTELNKDPVIDKEFDRDFSAWLNCPTDGAFFVSSRVFSHFMPLIKLDIGEWCELPLDLHLLTNEWQDDGG